MRLLIDTGFFVAYLNKRDVNHSRAIDLMKQLLSGENIGFTSDYIFDEAVTVALARTGRADVAKSVGQLILGDGYDTLFSLYFTGEQVFNEAWKLFGIYSKRGLSFTDTVSLALIEMHGLDAILSFDSDFDGIVPRIS